jgi:hypothetical protein
VKRFAPIALLLMLPALWLAGEMRYAARIRPTGIRTVAQHFERFGRTHAVYPVRRANDDEVYYEVQGFPGGGPPLLAAPSDAPAYVYDRDGVLVDWCSDPGDSPEYRLKWARVAEESLDVEAFHARFAR